MTLGAFVPTKQKPSEADADAHTDAKVATDGGAVICEATDDAEILKGNGTTVRDWSYESGTLMGLHIEIGVEPSGNGDERYSANL